MGLCEDVTGCAGERFFEIFVWSLRFPPGFHVPDLKCELPSAWHNLERHQLPHLPLLHHPLLPRWNRCRGSTWRSRYHKLSQNGSSHWCKGCERLRGQRCPELSIVPNRGCSYARAYQPGKAFGNILGFTVFYIYSIRSIKVTTHSSKNTPNLHRSHIEKESLYI